MWWRLDGCNSGTGEAEADWMLEFVLGYVASLRLAWATKDPVSKQNEAEVSEKGL